jgi:hypothetical protein
MTTPYYINEDQSDFRGIKPGWYGVESNGKLSSGPFFSREECHTGIIVKWTNSMVSPWSQRKIKCPECGGAHVRPCIRIDERGWEWSDNTCERCGRKLDLEEIRGHLVD